jgi:hypothetical protein
MIGLLMYLKKNRPDICFAMNTLSEYRVEPRHVHLVVSKHVLRYLKGTNDYVIKYVSNPEIILQGYTNLDWSSSVVNQKITYGC